MFLQVFSGNPSIVRFNQVGKHLMAGDSADLEARRLNLFGTSRRTFFAGSDLFKEVLEDRFGCDDSRIVSAGDAEHLTVSVQRERILESRDSLDVHFGRAKVGVYHAPELTDESQAERVSVGIVG